MYSILHDDSFIVISRQCYLLINIFGIHTVKAASDNISCSRLFFSAKQEVFLILVCNSFFNNVFLFFLYTFMFF